MNKRGILAAIVVAAACTHYAGNEITGQTSAAATISPSTFEIEGDLLNGVGSVDWQNAPNFVRKKEDFSGAQDDSFTQGAKEDTPEPVTETGSIPPNKSDLARFYVASETLAVPADGGADAGTVNQNFLYLAWVRTNTLGSANMDFELNQSSTPSANGKTPVRTAGDLLITYDFEKGGTQVDLAYHLWVATGPKSLCYSANDTPCWGVKHPLAGVAIGAINNIADGATTPDPRAVAGEVANLAPRTFGEAAINLTAAGITPAGACKSFASAYLKSRSSAAFTSELKDFIAPASVDIGTCPSVKLKKVDGSGNPLGGATLRLYKDDGDGDAGAGDIPIPKAGTTGSNASDFLCETTAEANECTFNLDAFGFGTYIARETVVPPGYSGEGDKVFVVDGSQTTVTITFTNNAQYRVTTFVCDTAGKLHQSSVSWNGATSQSTINATQLPAGVTEAALCGITQGRFGDFDAGTVEGGAVTIP